MRSVDWRNGRAAPVWTGDMEGLAAAVPLLRAGPHLPRVAQPRIPALPALWTSLLPRVRRLPRRDDHHLCADRCRAAGRLSRLAVISRDPGLVGRPADDAVDDVR